MRMPQSVTHKRWIAVAVIGAALVVPVVTGFAFAWNPVLDHPSCEWVVVATVESLPANGVPQRLPVRVTRWDAWVRLPDEIIGHVFVRRAAGSEDVIAFPDCFGRQGWSVEYDAARNVFVIPCLVDFQFDLEGRKLTSDHDGADLSRIRTLIADGMVYVSP